MNHYNSQIMLAMSTFDLSGCIAWSLSTVAIPKYTSNGAPTFIYGAEGNNISCKIQGFLFQLNFTSIFYNISLSTYYLLGKKHDGHFVFPIDGAEYSVSHCFSVENIEAKSKSLVVTWSSNGTRHKFGFWRITLLSK
jgi:hypothetical protein